MGFLYGLCNCLDIKRIKATSSVAIVGGDEDDDEPSLRGCDLLFDMRSLQVATDFFSDSNRLGHGGFGSVYKGVLPGGQEVAVKKLSSNSKQGIKEFTNEVKLLLKTQHKNLVILLGCCVQGPEKMLVYEYLPNKSLDNFLFDREKSALLAWTTRFQIIIGIARGLLYLHEEAPERIIHRDIKASNILLDKELNPKISDFGLARLFRGDDTDVDTSKISGTRGYMDPKYALHGHLSVKTDVFSFGVLVLEIVSGRKNHDVRLYGDMIDLLGYTWRLFQEGKALELVDPNLSEYNPDEAALCIQLGLLCCQDNVADRPDMNSINLILSSDSFTLAEPSKPGLFPGHKGYQTATSSYGFTSAKASAHTDISRFSAASSFLDEYSHNSISLSSMNEGR